jgi:hypothetical protein
MKKNLINGLQKKNEFLQKKEEKKVFEKNKMCGIYLYKKGSN